MKKTLWPLSFLLLLLACQEVPTGNRRVGSSSNSLNIPGNTPGTNFSPTTPVGTPTTPNPAQPGFENCDLGPKHSVGDLGALGICQSSSDETHIKFKPTTTNTMTRTCFIPTYKDNLGASTYLGNPQCTHTEANKEYAGKLVKDRSGFQNYPLNGVMIMRDYMLVEYFNCMNAYVMFIQQNCFYNQTQQCVYLATQKRNEICTAFKTKYPNHYLDIRLN